MQAQDGHTWWAGIGWALLGGACLGGADAVAVGVGGRLWLGPIGWLALLAAGAAPLAVAGAASATALAWWRGAREPWTALALGAVPALALRAAELDLPLSAVDPSLRDPAVGVAGLVLAAALALGVRRVPAGRQILGALVVASPLLALQMGRLTLPTGRPGSEEHPELLLVTVDGLRGDRLAEGAELPALARLSAEGTRFEALVAPGSGVAAAASDLLQARPPAGGRGADRGLLSALAADDYVVGAFLPAPLEVADLAGAHVVDDDPGWPLGVGRTLVGRALVRAGITPAPRPRRAADVVQRALRFLERRGGRRAAWVHLEDPLPPFEPTAPFDVRFDPGRDPRAPGARPLAARARLDPAHGGALDDVTDRAWVNGRHAAEVAAVDAALGELLAQVDAAGRSTTTVVVVVGLRGLTLDEGPVWFGTSGPLRPERVDVPALVRWPGHVPTGARIGAPAELADLGATLRELLGVDADGSTAPSLRPTYEDRGLARGLARAVDGREVLVRSRGAFLWWTPDEGYAAQRVGTEISAWTPTRILELAHALPGAPPEPTAGELVLLQERLVPLVPPPGALRAEP